MATYSEVKTGFDEIAAVIRKAQTVKATCASNAQAASNELASLTTRYSDLISTVQAYGSSNAAEVHAKAELGKLQAEFTALKGTLDQIAAL